VKKAKDTSNPPLETSPFTPNSFLSSEDIDLVNLSEQELLAWWDWWLREAQASNELDIDTYSHGVFQLLRDPAPDYALTARTLPKR